jgi:agmatinase
MAYTKVGLPFGGIRTFSRAPLVMDLDELDADIAVFGIPFDLGTQYRSGARFGPNGIREGSSLCRVSPHIVFDHEDDEAYHGPDYKIVDCGDVDMLHGDTEFCFENIREFVRKIISQNAIPAAMGGDHAITTAILQALDNIGSFVVVQIDAHLDFVDNIAGQKNGQGSPMRRASELSYVTGMAQLGIRGSGSSSMSDFADAKAYGSVILSTNQVRDIGIEETLLRIPQSEQYYVTVDIDGMDAAIAPGTGTPSPGGFHYPELRRLLKGVSKKGSIIGFDIVEVAPQYDQSEITTQLAAVIMRDLMSFILKERSLSQD